VTGLKIFLIVIRIQARGFDFDERQATVKKRAKDIIGGARQGLNTSTEGQKSSSISSSKSNPNPQTQ